MLYSRKETHQHKLEAIVELAGRWQKRIDDDEWPELDNLLQTFSKFAQDYIKLLQQIPPEIARPQFALNRGIDKLLNEWSALSRACEQRFKDNDIQNDGLPGNLKGATRKLQEYCDRWNGLRVPAPYLKLTNPLVYFEKVYRLSRSVYAPHSPVISIPLTDYDPEYIFSEDGENKLRWPALAHEFGHHLYWNVLDLENAEAMRTAMRDQVVEAIIAAHRGEKIKGVEYIQQSQKMVERVKLWSQWLEEVFADVVGTLLDGPAYALSAQDIAAEQSRQGDDLIHGDHEHPAPYLRPLIALQVLRKMAAASQLKDVWQILEGIEGLIEQLEERWDRFCGKVGQKLYTDTNLSLKELKEDVTLVVEVLLTGTYWPKSGQNLLKRLGFYGQQTIPPDLIAFKVPKDDLQSFPESKEPSQTGEAKTFAQPPAPIDDDIPEMLKPAWMHLKSTVSGAEQESLAHWSLLLSLNLSDAHFHGTNHSCTWHLYYLWCHTHDPSSGDPIYGCSC